MGEFKAILGVALSLVVLGCSNSVLADPGVDAVNEEMRTKGLFQPHANTCGSGEVFLSLGSGGTSGGTGLCVEVNERASATWDDARQTCAQAGKRLLEPVEFKIACKQAGTLGLSNMTDDNEWVSNFAKSDHGYEPGGSWFRNTVAPVAGSGSCLHVSMDNIQHHANLEGSNPYRCVR